MGKVEEESVLHIDEATGNTNHSVCRNMFSRILRRIVGFCSIKCFVILILGIAISLSSMFWIPLFRSSTSEFDFHVGNEDPVQASFKIQMPISYLLEHINRLEYDIFEEIGMPNTKASVISMHQSNSSNWTEVVFGIRADPKEAIISPVALSILRSALIELVLKQTNFSLTSTIFGQSSSFEVRKFPGGITVVPAQFSFIWWKPLILFSFTLHNSISRIQQNLDQLKRQLEFGLHLRYYENVYLQLTNSVGSTFDPPVIVQASVLSDLDNHDLILPIRLKQLAQTITRSPAKNLGLNHSVFGKVNQISLSSFLQHSLGAPSSSPTPAPSPSKSNLCSSIALSSPSPCFHCCSYSPFSSHTKNIHSPSSTTIRVPPSHDPHCAFPLASPAKSPIFRSSSFHSPAPSPTPCPSKSNPGTFMAPCYLPPCFCYHPSSPSSSPKSQYSSSPPPSTISVLHSQHPWHMVPLASPTKSPTLQSSWSHFPAPSPISVHPSQHPRNMVPVASPTKSPTIQSSSSHSPGPSLQPSLQLSPQISPSYNHAKIKRRGIKLKKMLPSQLESADVAGPLYNQILLVQSLLLFILGFLYRLTS